MVRSGVEAAKTHGAVALMAALGHAEAGGERVLRTAIPFAERLLQRTKKYLEKKAP